MTKPTDIALQAEWDLTHPKPTFERWPNGELVYQKPNPFVGRGGARIPAVAELARKYTEDAITILAHIMKTGADSDKLKAIKILLERGHGRVPEVVEVQQQKGVNKVEVLRALNKNPQVVAAMGTIARELQAASRGHLTVLPLPDETEQDPED